MSAAESASGAGVRTDAAAPRWRRFLLQDLAALVVVGGGGLALVNAYGQSGQTVSSQSAAVVRPMLALTAPASGTVASLGVVAGEALRKGATVARIAAPGGGTAAVRAPAAGTVGQVLAAPGQAVTAGETVATEVAQGAVQVVAMVPESDVRRLWRGQRASVTVAALPGRSLSGRVAAIWPQTAQAYIGQTGMPAPPAQEFLKQTALVPVAVTLTHPPGGLAAGESAEVTIHVG